MVKEDNIIEVKNLTRRFDKFIAVDNISFEVKKGEIFGFLGPNGAGKSTTINMLCTLLKPSEGTAKIDGCDVRDDQMGVRRSIGLIFQEPTLDTRLTAWQNLKFHAMLYNIPDKTFNSRATELLKMVDLTDKMNSIVSTFSGGMKRRLEIVLGLLHHPKVLFLDEPTIGLDPQTRRRIWEYLVKIRDTEGLTVFLTTHYMDEAEICDRIAVIDGGKIVACGTPDELKAKISDDVVTLTTSDDKTALKMLQQIGASAEISKDGLEIRTKHGDEFIPMIIRSLDLAKDPVRVKRVNLYRPTMDDVFVQLTGKNIREQEADSSGEMKQMMQHMGDR